MDWALLHAIVLLTLPVSLVVALWYAGVKLPGDGSSIKRIVGVVVLVVLINVFTHALTPWYPYWQWAIPAACAIVFVAFARRVRHRRIGSVAFLLACLLVEEHAWMVGDGYTHLAWKGFFPKSGATRAGSVLESFAKDNGDVLVPEGWLDTPGLLVPQPSESEMRYFARPDLEMHWYTKLVGFAKNSESRELAVWCPGGRISEVKDRLEVRVREKK